MFNTLSFLLCGFMVMFMAAGFAMLESGMVRSKSVATICVKNIALYSIAGLMFYLVGYDLMYGIDEGGVIGSFSLFWSPDDAAALAEEAASFDAGYAASVPTGFSRWCSWLRRRRSCPAPWPSV